MKIAHVFPTLLLAAAGMALVSPSLLAGSDRLVMVMSAQKMSQYQLVHIRFEDAKGHPLQSDVMKRMEIRRGDCNSGEQLLMPEDYKFGFSPSKEMGIYLAPQAWQHGELCFSDPAYGQLKTTVKKEELGKSVVRVFE